ncbi:uncharacterized protein OCT59_023125 [Rhizophagus irregularis]|uniref:Uncharacterized protein n=1 Tax=Rhizophagus irregularis (strain DAOM 197198w) TaxID=1432141 RepID=A0A015JXV3_RHIIW|nr:hypothetical protein RirG_071980 [Rhizophagus irregularis DAOM 197198w]UZO29663.1 hypothetical protein OCT59_023125 [Rhizophagus irregularis]GBC35082.1 hypothetical protein GLOIN_2v1495784 [Rhizophagus irregularis DAOM 181602=DAOM 197198]
MKEQVKELEKELEKEQVKELEKEQVKELEKELYGKECVAESIDFAVDGVSEDLDDITVEEELSCDLAKIFTRNKEVVAVMLETLSNGYIIYLSKNTAWLENDNKYVNNITCYLKTISTNAPKRLVSVETAFVKEVVSYCSAKLESIFEKLKNDLKTTDDDNYIRHIKSFKDFILAKDYDMDMHQLSKICYEYYNIVKDDSSIPPKFLGHINKAGSYIESMLSITRCVRNKKYKSQFSNVIMYKGVPDIIKDQPIYSWKNIIKRFTDDYKVFMDNCSKKSEIMERIRKVYNDKDTQQHQLLDSDDVKQRIYLHPAMTISAYIINNNIKKKGCL